MAQKLVQYGQKVASATPGLLMRIGAKGAGKHYLYNSFIILFTIQTPAEASTVQETLDKYLLS